MSSQYGEHRPTNGWNRFTSYGHPSTFQWVSRIGFVTAATLVTRGQPNFARCLAISWVAIIYTLSGALAPWRNFARCKIHFMSKSCVLLYWQSYCTALEQWLSTKLRGVVEGMELRNFRRGHHLYSAGQPSRWASANILVVAIVWPHRPYYIHRCGLLLMTK